MKRSFLFAAGLLALSGFGAAGFSADDSIRIVTTTSVLADFAKEITANGATVHAVAPPARDLHFVSPTPRDVLRVKKADVFIHHGLEAEPWRAPLLHAAGRGDFLQGDGAIDASQGIELLHVPTVLTRLEGDIHAGGNPHYWTDPENAKKIVATIAEGLARLYPDRAAAFRQNAEAFRSKIDGRLGDWQKRLAPYKGSKVITYHRSWPYFLKRFGLESAGEVEPKPGIPPTARHLSRLMQVIREDGVRVIIKEPFHEGRSPGRLAGQTGAVVAELAQFPGAKKEARDYLSMMDYNVHRLEEAFEAGRNRS